jgi:hypothetical protein
MAAQLGPRLAALPVPLHVRVRVSEMPRPPVPSIEEECVLCHTPVWTETATAALPIAKVGSIVCYACATAELEEHA